MDKGTDHLICFLRNLYTGQEATVRTGHETTDWFQIRKWVCQGYILSPCLFNLYADYIVQNAGLDEAQAGMKIARRNINNFRYANDNHPCGRKWRRTKEPLDKSEIGEWKFCLKLSIQKNKDHGILFHYFMVSRGGKSVKSERPFIWDQNHCRWWLQQWN